MLALLLAIPSLLVTVSSQNLDFDRIHRDLSRLLSRDARIVLPSNPAWTNVTTRWSPYNAPSPSFVIEVASEEDVVASVKYARQNRIPFAARNTGHGSTSTLEHFNSGMQINIGRLNSVHVERNSDTAEIGGGARNSDVILALYAAGKESTTGTCACVGFLGAGLGGGHGLLQGLHGLILDNIISARVVTANGEIVEASRSRNPDLFWALRGAGHNFGIVTSIRYRVYPLTNGGDWWQTTFIFSEEKIEAVTEAANEISRAQPQTLGVTILLSYTDLNDTVPSISVQLFGISPASEEMRWGQYFRDLSPLRNVTEYFAFSGLVTSPDTGLSSMLCRPGTARNQWPVGARTREPTTLRAAWGSLRDLVNSNPGLRSSNIFISGYPLRAFQEIDERSTAYPHREVNNIILSTAAYTDPALDEVAIAWGRKTRALFRDSSGMDELKVYVNYAQGDETLEQVYGPEEWRLGRLRRVKKEFDPDNQFGFYEPIA